MLIKLAIGPVAIFAALLLLLPLLSHARSRHAPPAPIASHAPACEDAQRICLVDPGNVCCL